MFELRPLGVADVLDAAWRLYRRHFAQLIAISATLYVPLGAVYLVAVALGSPLIWIEEGAGELPFTPGGVAALAGLGLLLMLSAPVMLAAMARVVSAIYLGGTTTLRAAYRFALRRLGTLLGVTLLFGLVVGGIYLVGILVAGLLTAGVVGLATTVGGAEADQMPGVGVVLMLIMTAATLGVAAAVGVRLFFAPLAVALEERGPAEALSRSWFLTAGRFWPVALGLFVFYLFFQVLASIVVWPTQVLAGVLLSGLPLVGASLNVAVWLLAQIIFQPLSTVGAVLIYYDLRMRKEGFDLVMMAEAIGEPEPTVRAPGNEARPALFDVSPPPQGDEDADEP